MNNSDLIAEVGAMVDCLEQYRAYAEEMRKIGRGFSPVDPYGRSVDSVIQAAGYILDNAMTQA